jgi:hypothetical protein
MGELGLLGDCRPLFGDASGCSSSPPSAAKSRLELPGGQLTPGSAPLPPFVKRVTPGFVPNPVLTDTSAPASKPGLAASADLVAADPLASLFIVDKESGLGGHPSDGLLTWSDLVGFGELCS